MSSKGAKALTYIGMGVLSWYAGLKFWKPLVMYVPLRDPYYRNR